MESYKHLAAKQVLADWLASETGVFLEYPICEDARGRKVGLNPIWTEMARPNFNGPERYDDPPTYEECLLDGFTPLVIFDVASHHEGGLRFAMEVVHRHGITPRKLDRLENITAHRHGRDLSILVVDAETILRRCSPPNSWIELDPLMILGATA
jgi:hypothetical protein